MNELFNLLTFGLHVQSGPRDLTEQSQGVNYRSLGDLFYLAEQRKDTFRYDVAVQMIEIYNEQVRDLLVSDGLNKRYPFSYWAFFTLYGYKDHFQSKCCVLVLQFST